MRGQLGEDLLREIRSRNDIVEVISEYVLLKQSGRNYKALCPFHTERTPSFMVSPERQLFRCFGCGVSGDVFAFIMKMENVGFPEAARMLAERAGIDIPGDGAPGPGRESDIRALVFEANKAAAEYFSWVLLRTRQGSAALDYLRGRGIGEDDIQMFKLGYAPPGWDSLHRALTRKGLTPEILEAAGLVIRRRESQGFYDRFRNRVMFTIFDPHGRVVGFGGRVLDDSQPKYLNSPETVVFSKGGNLYGISAAREEIRASGRAVIVEGYTDVIAAHRAGVRTAVASLGTALTQNQARLLARYAKEVVLAYDADFAGEAATLRGMDLLSAAGLQVRVAVFPGGKDPDEVIRSEGRDAFVAMLDGARPLVEYKLDLALKNTDLSTMEGRVSAAARAATVVASIQNAVERLEYSRVAAERLGVPEEAFIEEVRKLGRAGVASRVPLKDKFAQKRNTTGNTQSEEAFPLRQGVPAKVIKAERGLLRLMLDEPGVYIAVRQELGQDIFSCEEHRSIAAAIVDEARNRARDGISGSVDAASVISRLVDDKAKAMAAGVFMESAPVLLEGRNELLPDYIKVLKEHLLRRRIRQMEGELKALEAKGDTAGFQELLVEWQELRSKLDREFASFGGFM